MYFEKLKGELNIDLGFVLFIGQFTMFPEVEPVLTQMRDCEGHIFSCWITPQRHAGSYGNCSLVSSSQQQFVTDLRLILTPYTACGGASQLAQMVLFFEL